MITTVLPSAFFGRFEDYGAREIAYNRVKFHYKFSSENFTKLEPVLKKFHGEDIWVCHTKMGKKKSAVHIGGIYDKRSQFAYEFTVSKALIKKGK